FARTDSVDKAFERVGMHEGRKRAPNECIGIPGTQHRRTGLVDVEKSAVAMDYYGFRRLFHQLTVPFLAGPQRTLGAHLLRDIAGYADQSDDFAFGVAPRRARRHVLAHHAVRISRSCVSDDRLTGCYCIQIARTNQPCRAFTEDRNVVRADDDM